MKLLERLFVVALASLLIACGAGNPATPAAQSPAPSVQPAAQATTLPTPAPTAIPTSAPPATIVPTQPSPTQNPSTGGLCVAPETALPPAPTPAAVAAAATPAPVAPAPPVATYKIINTYPHDPRAFTQGLVIEGDILYEGTGLNGQSSLRRVELQTGAILQSCALPQQFFGEGITIFGNRIFQITWQSYVGFVYDKESFALLKTFAYPTEGWGITHDETRLIMSDGSATLHFLDPETLAEIGRLDVYDDNGPVVMLNELEYIQGEIYANIWQTDRIARIDPQTGQVLGWIDLAGLLSPEDRAQPVDVLNGIAYDPQRERLFVTGKLWPKLFEIDLVNQ